MKAIIERDNFYDRAYLNLVDDNDRATLTFVDDNDKTILTIVADKDDLAIIPCSKGYEIKTRIFVDQLELK